MKKIFILILGIIIGTSITAYAAYKYQAKDVGYTPDSSNFKVDNVSSAINILYEKVTGGPTYVAPQTGQMHKGIVYLDPIDLTKTCTANNSSSETEKKTGCMKWYVFKDDTTKDEYTMILDHNTTARIKWNDDNKNVALGSSNIAAELAALVNTSGWKVTPRLITAQEVVDIVGGVSTWNVNAGSGWFYFEGTGTNKQTMPTYSASNRSKYAWLYDNLYGCRGGDNGIDYGCDVEDTKNDYVGTGNVENGSNYNYWTSTSIGTSSSGSDMWHIDSYGYLRAINANNEKYAPGIRPVITISKSIINS